MKKTVGLQDKARAQQLQQSGRQFALGQVQLMGIPKDAVKWANFGRNYEGFKGL